MQADEENDHWIIVNVRLLNQYLVPSVLSFKSGIEVEEIRENHARYFNDSRNQYKILRYEFASQIFLVRYKIEHVPLVIIIPWYERSNGIPNCIASPFENGLPGFL